MNLELSFLIQGNIPQPKSMDQHPEPSQFSLFKIFKNLFSSIFSVEKHQKNNPKQTPIITHTPSTSSTSLTRFLSEVDEKKVQDREREAITNPEKAYFDPTTQNPHIGGYHQKVRQRIRAYQETVKENPSNIELQVKALEELIEAYNSFMNHPQYKTDLNPLLRDAFSEENSKDKIDKILIRYAQGKEKYENSLNKLKTP